MECKYIQDELCTNPDCPMCADYCPVPYCEGVCKYEERQEERWILSPKGCFIAALTDHISLDEDIIDFIWHDFVDAMTRFGYIQED